MCNIEGRNLKKKKMMSMKTWYLIDICPVFKAPRSLCNVTLLILAPLGQLQLQQALNLLCKVTWKRFITVNPNTCKADM